jgi:hypothetical protein
MRGPRILSTMLGRRGMSMKEALTEESRIRG